MEGLDLKHKSIVKIVGKIEKLTGNDFFEAPDFWDADLCAIGLHRHEKLVYLSTYNFLGAAADDQQFFVEFELIDAVSFSKQQILKTLDGVSEETLLQEIKGFFGLE